MNRVFLGEEGTKLLQRKNGNITAEVTVSKKKVIKDIGDVVEYYDELKEAKATEKERKKKIKNILSQLWEGYKIKNF